MAGGRPRGRHAEPTGGAPGARPPYRWVILAAGSAAQVTFSAIHVGLPALGPALRRDFGLTLFELGVVLGAPTLGTVLTVYTWGLVADRVGERLVLTLGLLGCAAAAALAASASSYPGLTAALLMAGATGGCSAAASGRAVIGWFGPDERGFALGVRQTAVPVGAAAAAIVLPAVEGAAGVAAGFWLLAAALAGGALLAGALLRDPPVAAEGEDEEGRGPSPLRDRRLWRLAAGCSLLVAGQYALTAFFPVFVTESLGWSAGQAGTLLFAALALGAAGRIWVGRWSDARRRRVEPLRALALGGGVAAALAAPLAPGAGVLAVLALLVALVALWSWNGLLFAIAGELAGRARAGAALGMLITVVFLVGAVAPSAFGSVVELGSWPAGMGGVALAAVVAWRVLGPLRAAQGKVPAR